MAETEHPFYFGEGAALFGVLHRPGTDLARGPGWVLCSAFGAERNHSHRLLVEWARELCRHGYPALRFDYRGTGDSSGRFEDLAVGDHLDDIAAAVAELERWTGAPCGGLLGLRLGASLAALASARMGGLRRLVLWEPVADGRAYRDQLLRVTMANELAHAGARHWSRDAIRQEIAAGGRAFVDGFPLKAAMYESLASVEPGRCAGLAAARVLIVQIDRGAGGPPRREMEELRRSFAERGEACLETAEAPPVWLRTRQYLWRPPELFGKTRRWIGAAAGPGTGRLHLPPELPGAAGATRGAEYGHIRERPVHFSVAGQTVWGILHLPPGPAAARPRVIMLAAGETPRSAVFYSGLARTLAAAGWPTLRFDPRGIGDSHGEIDTASVAEVFVRIQNGLLVPDALAAIDFLDEELGPAPNVLTGLCGGAVTAVYAAASDPRVAGIAPLELRLHFDGASQPAPNSRGRRQLPWAEIFALRQSTLPLLAVRRVLHSLRARARRLRLQAAQLLETGRGDSAGQRSRLLAHLGAGANLDLLTAFGQVLARELPVLCVFAKGEERRHLEAALPDLLAAGPGVAAGPGIQTVPGADHNFVMPGCRERLADILLDWLTAAERPWADLCLRQCAPGLR
jgi:alpha/beta superfamily hydrolase